MNFNFKILLTVILLTLPITIQAQNEELTYQQEVTRVINQKLVTEKPTEQANKCEVLVMMQRAFSWDIETENINEPNQETKTRDQFDDTDEWCEPYTKFATTNNIVQGRSATILGLDTPVSRFEVATMLYRELKRQNYPLKENIEVKFTDQMPDWSKEPIEKLAIHGIIKGFPDGTFSGEASVLKQDLGVMLLRTSNQNTQKPPTTSIENNTEELPNPNPEVTEQDILTEVTTETYTGFTQQDSQDKLSTILQLNYDKDNSFIYTESTFKREPKVTYHGTFKKLTSPENLLVLTASKINGNPIKDLKTIEFLIQSDKLKLKQYHLNLGTNGVLLSKDNPIVNSTFTWEQTTENNKTTLSNSKTRKDYTLTFNAESKILLETDCNSFNGNYTLLPDNKIILYSFTGTKKACLNSIENEYIQPFTKVISYKLENQKLTLIFETGQIQFTKK